MVAEIVEQEETMSEKSLTMEIQCSEDLGLRHRVPWKERINDILGFHEVQEFLDEDDDVSCLGEEEDGMGCPLPSTPEDDRLLDCEVVFLVIICSCERFMDSVTSTVIYYHFFHFKRRITLKRKRQDERGFLGRKLKYWSF